MRPLPLLLLLAACEIDRDEDGLLLREERAAGTDPRAADSDGDGVSDGDEAERGTGPLDPDTDADGVEDGEEADAETDPLDADTDDDGLSDGEERDLGTDPRSPDSDGDRVGDRHELDQGLDPLAPDSDADGFDDGDELDAGADPLDPDTDADRLEDGDEVGRGTDVLDPDSDADGYLDGDEVMEGTDPLDRLSRIYEGGWPYRHDKDDLLAPSAEDAWSIGLRPPRVSLPDVYGQQVDLYDLAGAGTPVVILLGADGEATRALVRVVRGDEPPPEGLEGLPEAVDDARVLWAHLLVADSEGGPADLDTARRLGADLPDPRVPLMADPDGLLAPWRGALELPAVVWCDADLRVQAAGPPGEVLPEMLDEL